MDHDDPSVILRQLTVDDIPALISLNERCFPGMEPWTRAHLRSQMRHFPEGQVGIFIDGGLVASASSLIVDDAEYDHWHDWEEISDDGWIRNHDPDGDTLYGIEIQVDPGFRGRKLARRLYDARKALCRDLNLTRMIIGGRIPGYAEVAAEMPAQAYVDDVVARRRFDPVLTTQLANGFEVVQLVEDYLPTDEDSAGWATILEWINTDHVPARSRRDRRAVFPVRVALVQYPMRRVPDWDAFAQGVEYYVDTASDYRSDFLLLPELFTVQLLSLVPSGRPHEQARHLADFTDRYLELFRRLSVAYNINIIAGSQLVRHDDGRLTNDAFLFRRDGSVGRQPKLHITPAEHRWWGVEGGDDLQVFDTDRGKIAVIICYDVEFPELVRIAVDRGARMIFVPFNTNDRQGYLRVRHCAHARCIENHVYVVMAGCVGHLPQVENADLHYARSAVLTPCDIAFPSDGVAAETAPAIEELIVQDLDLEHLRRHRARGTVRNWNDRRTDLYGVRWKKDGEV